MGRVLKAKSVRQKRDREFHPKSMEMCFCLVEERTLGVLVEESSKEIKKVLDLPQTADEVGFQIRFERSAGTRNPPEQDSYALLDENPSG